MQKKNTGQFSVKVSVQFSDKSKTTKMELEGGKSMYEEYDIYNLLIQQVVQW